MSSANQMAQVVGRHSGVARKHAIDILFGLVKNNIHVTYATPMNSTLPPILQTTELDNSGQ